MKKTGYINPSSFESTMKIQSPADIERMRKVILSILQKDNQPKIQTVSKSWQSRVKHFRGGMYGTDYDTILISHPETVTPDKWLTILIHELGHSTGHDSRLGRLMSCIDTSPDYAQEELVAWYFTELTLRHLSCATDSMKKECEIQILDWSSKLDILRVYCAWQEAEQAFQYITKTPTDLTRPSPQSPTSESQNAP
jgi:hypothetical protein